MHDMFDGLYVAEEAIAGLAVCPQKTGAARLGRWHGRRPFDAKEGGGGVESELNDVTPWQAMRLRLKD